MPISVIVIAHNEEARIAECLGSLRAQSLTPDEIIVVAHNSTDKTAEIARTFAKVSVHDHFTEEKWPIFARIQGFKLAKHDIIACIDGDSVARPDWLEILITPLLSDQKKTVATGGMVWFKNDFFGNLMAFYFFLLQRFNPWFHFYFWGSNFACLKSAYLGCGGLEPYIGIKKNLGLHFWAEDCYLSIVMERIGKVKFVRNAIVIAYPWRVPNGLSRWLKMWEDLNKIFEWFEIK